MPTGSFVKLGIKTVMLISYWVLFGCGIKGDPLPPAEQETVQKQVAPLPPEPIAPSPQAKKKKIKK